MNRRFKTSIEQGIQQGNNVTGENKKAAKIPLNSYMMFGIVFLIMSCCVTFVHYSGENYDDNKIINNDARIKQMETKSRLERYSYIPPLSRNNAATKKDFLEQKQTCGDAPNFDNFFQTLDKHKRSLNKEDMKIYNLFFRDNTAFQNGTFIEMGAYDGVVESNSRFFDICLGWEGILIEPNPLMYPKLYTNRPHAHKLSYAPSCSLEEEKEGKMIMFHDYDQPNAGVTGYAKTYDGRHEVPVPCGTLTPAILDLIPDGRINFFSLDVEGAEPLVLENIDFNQVFIDVLMVESMNIHCPLEPAPCETREKARAIMEKEGFILYKAKIYKSDVFINPKSDLLARVQVESS